MEENTVSRNSIESLPWLVHRILSEFLDYPSWFNLQSAVPSFKNHSPDILTFNGLQAYETVWNNVKLDRKIRFHGINEDDIYGGVVKPEGNIAILLKMIKSSRLSFTRLVVLDLSKQIIDRYQLSELFCANNASTFTSLKSVSLRVSIYSGRDNPTPPPTVPPAGLENVELFLTYYNNYRSVFESIIPLIRKAQKLVFLIDHTLDMVSFFEALRPLSNLVDLTLNGMYREMFGREESRICSIFPRLRRIVFRYPDGDYVTEIGEANRFRPSMLSLWCSDSVCASDLSFGRELESGHFLNHIHNNIPNCIIPRGEKSQMYTWFMRKWDTDYTKNMGEFQTLKEFTNLREVKLPSDFFLNTMNFKQEFQEFAEKGDFVLPTVQSLHFIPIRPANCVSNFVTFRPLRPSDITDTLLLPVFKIFPNIRSLSIAPIPFLQGGEVFHYLTTQTKLSNLMVLHNRINSGTLSGRLDFRTWLPFTTHLDAFLYYTRQLMWSNESTQDGLLDCLCRNKSLRYVCIITDVPDSTGHIGLSASAVEKLGSKWYADKDGRYLIFVFLHRGNLTCYAVKPKTRKSRKPYTFERNSFASWLDLERTYPELYSVFWRTLRYHIQFHGRPPRI